MLELNSAVHEPKPQPQPPRRKRDRRRTLTKIDQRSRLGKRPSVKLTTLFFASKPLAVIRHPSGGFPDREQAAQLSAIAELARGDHMRGRPTGDIVRLERAAAAAVRSLGDLEPKPKQPTLAELLAARSAQCSRGVDIGQAPPLSRILARRYRETVSTGSPNESLSLASARRSAGPATWRGFPGPVLPQPPGW